MMEAIRANQKAIANIERQIAQIAEAVGTRPQGKLPSDTVVNPSHNQGKAKEQVNAVIKLRGGKEIDNKVSASNSNQEDDQSDTEIVFDERDHLEKISKTEKPK